MVAAQALTAQPAVQTQAIGVAVARAGAASAAALRERLSTTKKPQQRPLQRWLGAVKVAQAQLTVDGRLHMLTILVPWE